MLGLLIIWLAGLGTGFLISDLWPDPKVDTKKRVSDLYPKKGPPDDSDAA